MTPTQALRSIPTQLALPHVLDGDLADARLFAALVKKPLEYQRWTHRMSSRRGWLRAAGDESCNTKATVALVQVQPKQLKLRIARLSAITSCGTPLQIDGPTELPLALQRERSSGTVYLTVDWDALATREPADVGVVESSPFLSEPKLALTFAPGDCDHVAIARVRARGNEFELDPEFVPPTVTVSSADAVQSEVDALSSKFAGLAHAVQVRLAQAVTEGRALGAAHEAARALVAAWRGTKPVLGDPALATSEFQRVLRDVLQDLEAELAMYVRKDVARVAELDESADLDDARRFACLRRELAVLVERWNAALDLMLGDALRWRSLRVDAREANWVIATIEWYSPLRAQLAPHQREVEIVVPLEPRRGQEDHPVEVCASADVYGGDGRICRQVERGADSVRVRWTPTENELDSLSLRLWARGSSVSRDGLERLSIRGGS